MREAISKAFIDGWTAALPEIPFALENESRPSADAFAQLTIQLTTARQMTQGAIGTRRRQTYGWINVKLWSPANLGVVAPPIQDGRGPRSADMAAVVAGIFGETTIASPSGGEPIVTQSPVTQTIGTDGRFYMALVRTQFWFTQTV